MKDMLDLNKSSFQHTDLQSTRIARDEKDVKSLVAMLQTHWLTPFSIEQRDLVRLSTGTVATPKIQQDLINANAVGEKAYATFRVERLESQPLKTKLHDTISKAKLQSCKSLLS